MAPETVCLIMQTLYKSTLNEAFTIGQIVDAVVVLKNLPALVFVLPQQSVCAWVSGVSTIDDTEIDVAACRSHVLAKQVVWRASAFPLNVEWLSDPASHTLSKAIACQGSTLDFR